MLFPLYDYNPTRRFASMTVLIIAANVAVMVWMSQMGPARRIDVAYHYGLIPKRVTEVGNAKPIVVQATRLDRWGNEVRGAPKDVFKLPVDPRAVYVTFLTTMFLHGGWFHLASNMWMLWVFGNNIEDRLGHLMYVVYYLLGGLVASLTHWAVDPISATPVIGASGAVAAVLGGYAVTYPKAKVRTLVFFGLVLLLDLPALVVLGFWFAMQLVAGVGMLHGAMHAPVAFWAHIGGFIAGIVLLPFLSLGAPPPESDWHKEIDDLFNFEDPRLREKEPPPDKPPTKDL